MSKAMKRMILDVSLTVMLIFEMFYQLTGNALHEYVGFAFFICILAHLFISRKWIYSTVESLGEKEMNFRRKVLAFIAFLLTVDMLLLGASSVIISNTFWNMGLDFSAFNPGDIWVPIHTATSYGLCIVVAAHLASHWSFLAKNLHIEYNPERRRAIGQAVNVAVGMGALALGVTGYSQVTQAIANEQVAEREMKSTSQQNPETQVTADDQIVGREIENTSQQSPAGQVEYTDSNKHTRGKKKAKAHGSVEQDTATNANSGQEMTDYERYESSNVSASKEYPEDYAQEPTYEEAYTEESTSNYDGVCTLCRKRCSFSNMRCDRPYAEGLL